MVKRRKRGVSIMSALMLMTIVIMVAATMAGVFTLNMNVTQRVSNGNVALAEAEAGIAEVLYQITREENLGDENADKNPEITWGQSGETIRATITPGMSPEEAYHVVTFDTGSSFPYSTNNTTLDNDSGSMGRTVPDGKLHLVSTGYCKGQFRTVECVVERPPFPFGLASSGKIHSRNPLRVVGTSSMSNYQSGDEDRPGHVLCNSPEGVQIDPLGPGFPGPPDDPDRVTEISGFVKSVGPVNIAQPAVVRGGIRTGADVSTLADIDIEAFRNQGKPGVVTLLDDYYGEAQEMDIMYYHPGGSVTYDSQVALDQAMLYCDGDLTINGPVTGEGLIVVKGNATFNSGTSLAGTNKLAILAGGNITINGNNNYFSGLVYCEGVLDASDITIVGNTIVNSSDNTGTTVDLENVTIVSNEDTADMTITVTSSTNVEAQSQGGRFPFPLQLNNGVFGMPEGIIDGSGLAGWPPDDLATIEYSLSGAPPAYDSDGVILSGGSGSIWDYAMTGEEIVWGGGYFPPDSGPFIAGMQGLIGLAEEAQGIASDIESKQADLAAEQKKPDDEQDSGKISSLQNEIANLKEQMTSKYEAYTTASKAFAQQVYDYGQSHTDANGTYDNGNVTMDITEEHRFNLNEYLPESEKIKMSFWKVYPRRF